MLGDGIIKLLRELDQEQQGKGKQDDDDVESVMEDIDKSDEYDSFVKEIAEFKNGNEPETQGVLLYVYQPWCPHCQKFTPIWESEIEKLQNKNDISIKSFKLKADDIHHDDDLIPPKNTVPQVVMYYYKSPSGVVTQDFSDEETRHELSTLVRDLLGVKVESESDEELEDDTKKDKVKKQHNQKGKGIVESILTAGILGGAVISSTKSPQVSSILKETVKGIESITTMAKSSIEKISGKKPSKNVIKEGISSATKAINAQKYADATTDAIKGISQTTADVIQGKVKKLTKKDLMRVYKTFKSSRPSKLNKSSRKASRQGSKSNKTSQSGKTRKLRR